MTYDPRQNQPPYGQPSYGYQAPQQYPQGGYQTPPQPPQGAYGYQQQPGQPVYGYQPQDYRPRPQANYEILEHIATLKDNPRYQTRVDMNVLRWNGGKPKLDVRTWKGDGAPGGGVTLSFEEAGVMADTILAFLERNGLRQPSAPSSSPSPVSPPDSTGAAPTPMADDGATSFPF